MIAPCSILPVLVLILLKTTEFKWDLLETIKRNSEDWGSDDGKESGMTPKFDCVKSFMDTDAFR